MLLAGLIAIVYWAQRQPEPKPAAAVDTATADSSADPTRSFESAIRTPPADALTAMPPAPPSGGTVLPPPDAASAPTAAVPRGMTADQWQALRERLQDDPNRDAEIARITEYMAYSADLQRYRALRAAGPAAAVSDEARRLARSLADGLPQRVAHGEIAAGEAMLLQESLLDTLQPDMVSRATERAAMRSRLQAAAPVPADAAAQAERQSHYRQQEATIVAAWQAQAPQQRDPGQLEASLDALRQSVFDQNLSNRSGPAPATPGGSR